MRCVASLCVESSRHVAWRRVAPKYNTQHGNITKYNMIPALGPQTAKSTCVANHMPRIKLILLRYLGPRTHLGSTSHPSRTHLAPTSDPPRRLSAAQPGAAGSREQPGAGTSREPGAGSSQEQIPRSASHLTPCSKRPCSKHDLGIFRRAAGSREPGAAGSQEQPGAAGSREQPGAGSAKYPTPGAAGRRQPLGAGSSWEPGEAGGREPLGAGSREQPGARSRAGRREHLGPTSEAKCR